MKKLVAILVLAALLVVAATLYMWDMLRRDRDQREAMQARLTELQTSHAETPATHPVQPPAAPATTGETFKSQDTVEQSQSAPQSLDATYVMWRFSLPLRFPDVGEVLNLKPEEVQRLYDLIARQQMDLKADTAGLLTAAAKDPAARLEMQRNLVEQGRANEAQLSEMLGSKYQQWQEYQSSRFVREHVDTLRVNLSSGTDALSELQAQSLVAALTPEQSRLDSELRTWDTSTEAMESQRMLDGHMRLAVENHRRLSDIASSYLTPQQRDELWKILDRTTMFEVTMTRQVGKLGTAPVRGGM
jgi:hypothetical protein